MQFDQGMQGWEQDNNRSSSNGAGARNLGAGLVISIVILSLLTGSLSGFLAGWYASKNINLSEQSGSSLKVVQEDSAIVDVVRKASPAVVSIIISKNLSQSPGSDFSNPFFFDPFFQFKQAPKNSPPSFQQVGAGSGFFVSPDGLILTNKHVVADSQAKYTVSTNDGKRYSAEVLARDPVNDLALVRIKVAGAPILRLADSSKIQIGQRVIAIGNSLGQYRNTVTTGVVSGIGRNIIAGGQGTSEQLDGVIQTDAAINPGNSGGPLLNIAGQVIGVNTAIDQQGQLVGFAIPSNDAKKDIDNFGKLGKIIRPFLGVRYVLINQAVKEQYNLATDSGAWVSAGNSSEFAVIPDSAADRAGIKDNDIIISVNNIKVDQNSSLTSLIKNYNPDDVVTFEILRGAKTLKLQVKLGQK